MPQTDKDMRDYFATVVMDRLDKEEDRRQEALSEYLAVAVPSVTDTESRRIAELIPPVLPALYARWVDMFLDRLFETVPREQLVELCSDTMENRATVILVYLMFMESARMEKQVADDLAAYGREHSLDADMGDVAYGLLRAKIDHIKSGLQEKA